MCYIRKNSNVSQCEPLNVQKPTMNSESIGAKLLFPF